MALKFNIVITVFKTSRRQISILNTKYSPLLSTGIPFSFICFARVRKLSILKNGKELGTIENVNNCFDIGPVTLLENALSAIL